MTYDSRELKNICVELGISPNEHFILYSLYQNDRSLEEMVYEYKRMYGKSPFSRKEIENLVDKGYLLNLNGFDDLIFDEETGSIEKANYSINLKVTPEFEKMFFVATKIAGEELFEAYQKFMVINGNSIPLKGPIEANGRFYDRRKLVKEYAKRIQNNRILHKKVLDAVGKAAEMKQLNISIGKFIFGELWNDYINLGDNSQTNITVL